MVDGRRRRLDGYTINSPHEPNGSDELITGGGALNMFSDSYVVQSIKWLFGPTSSMKHHGKQINHVSTPLRSKYEG